MHRNRKQRHMRTKQKILTPVAVKVKKVKVKKVKVNEMKVKGEQVEGGGEGGNLMYVPCACCASK